jgi:hypothetical protein
MLRRSRYGQKRLASSVQIQTTAWTGLFSIPTVQFHGAHLAIQEKAPVR